MAANSREEVKRFTLSQVSRIFEVPEADLTEETTLLDDLGAKSVDYFPLISALEDQYDIELEYQPLRRKGRTIGDVVDIVLHES